MKLTDHAALKERYEFIQLSISVTITEFHKRLKQCSYWAIFTFVSSFLGCEVGHFGSDCQPCTKDDKCVYCDVNDGDCYVCRHGYTGPNCSISNYHLIKCYTYWYLMIHLDPVYIVMSHLTRNQNTWYLPSAILI